MSARSTPTFRSSEHDQGRFRAHGAATLKFHGRVAHVVAEGPFNLELIQAMARIYRAASARFPADGRYVDLIEFRASLLMPPDALQALTDLVAHTARLGFLAAHTVFVIDEEVEARALMLKRVTGLWSPTRPISVHASVEAGLAEAQALAASLD